MENTNKSNSLLPPKWLIFAISIVISIFLLVKLKEMFILIILGLAISYIIEPILLYLESKKVRRIVGICLIGFVFALIIFLITVTVAPVLLREFQELLTNLPRYIVQVKSKVLPFIEKFETRFPSLSLSHLFVSSGAGIETEILQRISNYGGQALLKGYSITLAVLNLVLLPFIIFYISMDFPKVREFILNFFPPKVRTKVNVMLSEIDDSLSGFVRGQLIVCISLFILYAVGLASLRIELWGVLALISGFGHIVPYLGLLLGIVLSSIMALVTHETFTSVLLVWALYVLIQFIEGTFITPKVLGEKVGLSPLVVILAILAGGSLFGLLGIFLAIPGVAIGRVLFTNYYNWLVHQYD